MASWITDELLNSLRSVESGGNRFAVSKAGAKGPYQFMDATAKELGLDDPFDEVKSRAAARKYLTTLDARFGNARDALTAYNWGQGNLGKMIKTGGTQMPLEARQYAGKVLGNKMDYFDQLDPTDPRVAALRNQPRSTSLSQRPDSPPAATNLPNPVMQPGMDGIRASGGMPGAQGPQGPDYQSLIEAYGNTEREAIEEANRLRGRNADYSKWQDYAKQRSQAGGQHLMLALAAQQAGKEFAPISAHYLKQAMAAQDPIQAGKAGMITAEGEFIADPNYGLERDISSAEKRAELAARARGQAVDAYGRSVDRQIARDYRESQGPKPQLKQDKNGNYFYLSPGQTPVPAGLQGEVSAPTEPKGPKFAEAGFSPRGARIVADRDSQQLFEIGAGADGKPTYAPYNGAVTPRATWEKQVAAVGDAKQSVFRISNMIDSIKAYPRAFGDIPAIASLLPNFVTSRVNEKALTPEERNARSMVQRQAAIEVNELYGAALTMGEERRANSFIPAGTDKFEDTMQKLISARQWAEGTVRRYGDGVSGAVDARTGSSGQAPTAPGGPGTAGTPIRAPQQPQIIRGL